ncbi:MAG: tetratricopeptide repeat protein [Saprospiraceae bacterium]
MSLNNLAIVYNDMGQYKAELLLIEAKAILKKALGNEHPDYALSLNNLAGQYNMLGKYEKQNHF